MLRLYRTPALSPGATTVTQSEIQARCGDLSVKRVSTELCFFIELGSQDDALSDDSKEKIKWILSCPFKENGFSENSFFSSEISSSELLVEIGPRLNFSTAFCTNAVSICHGIGLTSLWRIECSIRYLIEFGPETSGKGDQPTVSKELEQNIVDALHDRMTQCRYTSPVTSFKLSAKPESVYDVDVLTSGKAALEKVNAEMGLALDNWDLEYYTDLFQSKIKRNPTNVECFDLAQSNSEHSRHWFFKGKMVVDGEEHEKSLFQLVMSTQEGSNQNNVIKFSDNSSGIEGYKVKVLRPQTTCKASAFGMIEEKRHIVFTAETHNFPTAVAPFPGATTGTGGRIRDVQAAGRGAHVIAGTAGYCFGNLLIPGYHQPWEDTSFTYPRNFALPVEVAVEASNGASDYGNKFGEPVLAGFARSFGMRAFDRRIEWVKPIMFSGGIGSLNENHVTKMTPTKGMHVLKVGGPVYRIGVGGGAASSIAVQGDNVAELDFGAVQRGDAEMEQKMNRVVRACIELGARNPICSIHDQGAGGNGNVLKEICEPVGALIKASRFELGDPTLNLLEIWGAEYQESNAILIKSEDVSLVQELGEREKCPVSFVGEITDTGKIQFEDDLRVAIDDFENEPSTKKMKAGVQYPVDLDLEYVLGSMPRKVFQLSRRENAQHLKDIELPQNLSVHECLERVLRLPSVASKRYLTNKVDRSVTGLVAQQQCVGPLHTPLADVAVTALSHFSTVGSATAIGEQPIKGLISPSSGAQMTVGEALTNLVFAKITDLKDVKCSGNWMWPGKRGAEGAALFDTCTAMCDIMERLGIAVDGGKDSLSMSARVDKELVNAPGTLVVSVYVGCPDIKLTVTPDLKCPDGKGCLLFVSMSGHGRSRLGGSALAQCFGQLGCDPPLMDEPEVFVKAFRTTQDLIQGKLLAAGHDVSDGGLVTCLLEMAFAGNCGVDISLPSSIPGTSIEALFAEELGLVVEVAQSDVQAVLDAYANSGISCVPLGYSMNFFGRNAQVLVRHRNEVVLDCKMTDLRDIWEETSFQLENFQCNPDCVAQEAKSLKTRTRPKFRLSFQMAESRRLGEFPGISETAPSVAVIREEGSNGDREMAAAFHMAGFKVWDVNMQDLCRGHVTLDQFRGIAFVGGFSYADVCGSAKGWAATLKYDASVKAQFEAFFARKNTFSLGVCNGCQLMALLGWVAPDHGTTENARTQGVHLDHNLSDRFESRFVTVKISKSPSIMLLGMEESVLGIWLAHGEGRFVFKRHGMKEALFANQLVPLQYVDDSSNVTEAYPLNPNGSPSGIAALCSAEGRHLAMMPHAERSVLPWQWPWMPRDWRRQEWHTAPWLQMFQNAFDWCSRN